MNKRVFSLLLFLLLTLPLCNRWWRIQLKLTFVQVINNLESFTGIWWPNIFWCAVEIELNFGEFLFFVLKTLTDWLFCWLVFDRFYLFILNLISFWKMFSYLLFVFFFFSSSSSSSSAKKVETNLLPVWRSVGGAQRCSPTRSSVAHPAACDCPFRASRCRGNLPHAVRKMASSLPTRSSTGRRVAAGTKRQ